jgi:hypothetical protein
MADTACMENTGAVTGGVRTLVRLEGLTLFAGMTLLYAVWDGSWLVYAILFLAPDLSFAAYLAGPKPGAIVYNAAHSYMAPVSLMVGGSPISAGSGRTRPRQPDVAEGYFSPSLNGGSLPGGTVSSAMASIMATMT